MLRVGLTGGIACGKSTVCLLFHELGAPVIDTDTIARELVGPGMAALSCITEQFGNELLDDSGQLIRSKLRELVFHDADKLSRLEAILHPLIRQEVERRLATVHYPYAIIAIPLLLEKGWQNRVDRVTVVDCSEEQQLARAVQRDASSTETIRRIIASQVSRNTRLEAADDIIDNNGSAELLAEQVKTLHHRYLALASGS